jgi:hypothetical protein
MLSIQLALRTERYAARITLLFEIFETRVIIGKLGVKVGERKSQFGWNVLFDFHLRSLASQTLALVLLDIKG